MALTEAPRGKKERKKAVNFSPAEGSSWVTECQRVSSPSLEESKQKREVLASKSVS